MEGST
jgi:hypothetical protein